MGAHRTHVVLGRKGGRERLERSAQDFAMIVRIEGHTERSASGPLSDVLAHRRRPQLATFFNPASTQAPVVVAFCLRLAVRYQAKPFALLVSQYKCSYLIPALPP
jgi:hypothetical protein